MGNIQAENEIIQKNMRELARNLFNEKKVDMIIGYARGTIPLSSSPIFIRSVEQVDNLIWDNLCYVNLARYVVPPLFEFIDDEKVDLKVGIVSRGCIARTLIHLAKEKQINTDNIKIIGIPCNGIVNRRRIEKELGEREVLEILVSNDEIIVKGIDYEEKLPFQEYLNELCKTCKVKSPPMSSSLSNVIVGESIEIESVEDDFSDLEDYESKTPEEKWQVITELLSDCTRCYACREACPMCYCNLCFIDQNKPIWFGKTSDISDIVVFHLVRAMHMTGRCVGCGSCSSVCPMGIDLKLINRKLEKIVKERFDFTAGLNLEVMPPMMTQKMEDSEDFMLGEH
ncbi:MAG: 4Fe-4S binding protein [Promethearchaeota archaeon]